MNNKVQKKPLFQSKLPSKKSTGSKLLGQMKNPAKIEEKNAKNVSLKQIVSKRVFLTYKITNDAEYRTKIQEILDLKQSKFGYNIVLTSILSDNKQLLMICSSLGNIGPSIKNLVWNVRGYNIGDGYAEGIGNAIRKMSSAYSIVLNMKDCTFTDRAATSLGKALSCLEHLKILKLNIELSYNIKEVLTDAGKNKLIQGIKGLSQQLDVFETNIFPFDYKNQELKLNNYVFELENKFDEEDKFSLPLTLEEFNSQIQQGQSYRITELLLRQKHRYRQSISPREEISYETGQVFLSNAIRYSLDNFPYLNKFTNQIFNCHVMQDIRYDNKHLFQYIRTFEELMNSKLAVVTQILVFNLFLRKQQTMNPLVIIADLFIE